MKQAADEYAKTSTLACPIFCAYLNWMAAEQDIPHGDLVDEDFVADLHSRSPECVVHTVQKVGMARWFQFISSVHHYCKMWSQRLIITMFMLMMMGTNVRGGLVELMKIKVPVRSEADDVDNDDTKDDNGDVRRARALPATTPWNSLAPCSARGRCGRPWWS